MRVSHTDPMIGRVVGAYRILGRLGMDGVAALYVAEHVHLDRKVAMRLFGPEVSWGVGTLDRFLADARRLSRVRQENVSELIDLGETGDGHVFLVLELPDGPTLDQAIAEQGVMSGARARLLAIQIGTALNAVAEVSLSNRDVSPRQVFLITKGDRRDVVKVDFSGVGLYSTKAGPPQDDVHTLGGLLYHMLVGWPPVSVANQAPDDPAVTRPDLEVPPDLNALMMQALDPDPARRWPDLLSMLHALAAGGVRATGSFGALAPGLSPTYRVPVLVDQQASATERLEAVPPAARPRRAFIGGAVAVAFAASLIVTMRFAGRDQRPQDRTVAAVTTGALAEPAPATQGQGARPAAPAARPVATPVVEAVPHVRGGDRGVFSGVPPMLARPGLADRALAGATPAPAIMVAAAPSAPPLGTGTLVRPPLLPGPVAQAEAGRGPMAAPAAARPGHPASGVDLRIAAPAMAQAGEAIAPTETANAAAPAAVAADDPAKIGGGKLSGGDDDACAVTLGSRPWSEVWIDGRKAGFTPLVDYPIDCGSHDVTFRSLELGSEKKMSVVVAAGKPFRKTVDLTSQDARAVGASLSASSAEPTTAGVPAGGLRPASAAPGGNCLVTLGSRPWSEVWIDGKRAGVTPLVDYKVACGKHEVLFRGGESNAERRETLVVQSGRVLKKVVALSE